MVILGNGNREERTEDSFFQPIFYLPAIPPCVLAKSLQSCQTLCDSVGYSLPDSSVHGDYPGKNTGVGCHALLQGIFQTQGSNSHLMFPALVGEFFTTSATWEAQISAYSSFISLHMSKHKYSFSLIQRSPCDKNEVDKR